MYFFEEILCCKNVNNSLVLPKKDLIYEICLRNTTRLWVQRQKYMNYNYKHMSYNSVTEIKIFLSMKNHVKLFTLSSNLYRKV